MPRQKIVAGNWKMNKSLFEGKELVDEILHLKIDIKENQKVVICPSFIQLPITATQMKGMEGYYLGAQNCHENKSGAYTGEVSAEMLKSTGVDYIILGHSERRNYFGETTEMLAKKVSAVLQQELKVIFCVGESLEIRESEKQEFFISKQIRESLFDLVADDLREITIAYEPIWAIGTGKNATPEQAQEMHHFIRGLIASKYGDEVANDISILYGGSVNPYNAADLFRQEDVDGGLIGGASLNAADFGAIIREMQAN